MRGSLRAWSSAMTTTAAALRHPQVGQQNFPGVVREGNGCLQITTTPGQTISSDGLASGASICPRSMRKIDLSLYVRAKDLTAAKDNGGLFVLAEFCNATGQNIARQFLVGAEGRTETRRREVDDRYLCIQATQGDGQGPEGRSLVQVGIWPQGLHGLGSLR